MIAEEINKTLVRLFGQAVAQAEPTAWQVETSQFRLLVLLSEDQSWLRILLPITPVQNAQMILDKLLEANFDFTQQARYAVHQNVLWGVFQHNCQSLTEKDFTDAIATLTTLYEQGLSQFYSDLIEDRILQIIQVAKRQGQSKETTLQNLDRFYAEGLLGDLGSTSQDREQTLAAWRYQLERLWPEVE